jgi:signal transduction histidine kinase
MFIAGYLSAENLPPIVTKGLLDLSSSPFETQITKLNGEWEFYWNQLESNLNNKAYLGIGEPWRGKVINGVNLSGTGFATYKVKILFPESQIGKIFMIKFFQNGGAALRISIDDKNVLQMGKVGETSESMIPTRKPEFTYFVLDKTEVNLTVEISNFYHYDGAFWYAPELGYPNLIQENSNRDQTNSALLMGSMFIISIYNFMIYIFRRKDFLYFYFGIFSLVMFLHGLFFWNEIIFNLNKDLSFNTSYFLSMIFILAVPSNLLYLNKLFPFEVPKAFSKLMLFLSVLAYIGVLVLPTYNSSYLIIPGLLFCMILLLISLIFLSISIYRKRKYSIIILISNVILLLSSLSDSISSYTPDYMTYFLKYSLLIYVIIQSFILANYYTDKYNEIDSLSEDIKLINANLESSIIIRTNEYKEEKEKAVNENIWKDKFISLVSHDLRSPLNTISISIDYILKNNLTKKEIFCELSQSKEIIQNSISMVKHLLHLSRFQNKKINLQYKDVDLYEICEFVLRDLTFDLNQKSITTKSSIKENTILTVDELVLKEIMRNLILNSIKYSENQKEIFIDYIEDDLYQIIIVKDQGCGMNQETLESIRNKKPVTHRGINNEVGYGIGLKLCNEIIELQRGILEVNSQENEGTTTQLKIPSNRNTILSFSTHDMKETIIGFQTFKILLINSSTPDEFKNHILEIESKQIIIFYDFTLELLQRLLECISESGNFNEKPIKIITPNDLIPIPTRFSSLKISWIQKKHNFYDSNIVSQLL